MFMDSTLLTSLPFSQFPLVLFRTLARDRRTPRWLALPIACPAFLLGFYARFLTKSSCICQHAVRDGAVNFRSIFERFSVDFRSIFDYFRSCFASGGPSASILSKTFEKLRSGGCASLSNLHFWGHFGTRPEPKNRQKTGPRPQKCVRRRRQNRFFAFSRAVVVWSRSWDRFLEGLTLENCAPTTAGARF